MTIHGKTSACSSRTMALDTCRGFRRWCASQNVFERDYRLQTSLIKKDHPSNVTSVAGSFLLTACFKAEAPSAQLRQRSEPKQRSSLLARRKVEGKLHAGWEGACARLVKV